jgi:hypothetical protein
MKHELMYWHSFFVRNGSWDNATYCMMSLVSGAWQADEPILAYWRDMYCTYGKPIGKVRAFDMIMW